MGGEIKGRHETGFDSDSIISGVGDGLTTVFVGLLWFSMSLVDEDGVP